MPTTPTKVTTIPRLVLVVVLIAVGLTGLHAALSQNGTESASAAEADGVERAAAVREFAVLRRPARLSDRPTPAVETLARSGTDPSSSRRATLPLGAPDVRILPRNNELCLVVEAQPTDGTAGYGCSPWAEARAGRLHLTLSGGPKQSAGQALVVGLLPDTADEVQLETSDGDRTNLTLSEGFYFAIANNLRAIQVTGTKQSRIDLGPLPGQRE